MDTGVGLPVAALVTLVGNATLTTLIVELIKRTGQLSDATVKRFGPLLACGVGTAVGILAALYLAGDVVQSGLTGFLAGATGAGLYDAIGEQLGGLVERATGGRIT